MLDFNLLIFLKLDEVKDVFGIRFLYKRIIFFVHEIVINSVARTIGCFFKKIPNLFKNRVIILLFVIREV